MSDTTTETTTTPTTTPAPDALAAALTAGLDQATSYEAKPATQVCLVSITDYKPDLDRETGEFKGHRISLAAAEPVRDEFGGEIPAGTRLGSFRLWTTEDQYRDKKRVQREWLQRIRAFNDIPVDKADKRYEAADAAAKALPPQQQMPMPLPLDPSNPAADQPYYDQWKGTVVLASFKLSNDGMVNLNGLMAKSTPRVPAR